MIISHDASVAWARTHMTFVLNDIASENRAAERIPYYEKLIQAYPELTLDCMEQIERIRHPEAVPAPSAPAQAERIVPSLYTPAPPLPDDDDPEDEEDLPF